MSIAGVYQEVFMPASVAAPSAPVVKHAPSINPDQQNWPLKIYTLGRFGLVRDGLPIRFPGKAPRKPLELLKILIAFGSRRISEERLIESLWPDAEAGCAASSFSSALHRLRRLLGDARVIQRQDRRISLNGDLCWVDAWAFERLSKQVQTAAHLEHPEESEQSEAMHAARLAIDIYTGNFLPSDENQPWSISMRERLRGNMLNLIAMVGRHWEATTDWHQALAAYQKGLEFDDLFEEFYQRLMICHCQLGNHGEVASVYQRCRITLAKLGVKPSPNTTTIYEAAIIPVK
jgi:two-component SAPR family response regulator